MRTVVVVPCYNEAARLDRDRILAHASSDLLLVDDGSTDGTGAVLRDLAARSERVATLALPRNRGKAEAVRQGLLLALEREPRYVGYWDADLSTPLGAIADFEDYLEARPGVDLLLGSRVQLLGRVVERSRWRHYAGRIFATAASETLGLPVYDTQCGAKLLRAGPGLAALLAEPFLARWSFDVEILARFVARHGHEAALARIHEFPLAEWRHVHGSKVRPWDLLTSLLELLRIRRRYFGTSR